jgi:hypothetical protein
MNTFWHFGDSFSFNDFNLESEWRQENNFGHIISKKFGMDYVFRSLTGISNQQIFHYILKETNNFKKGDFVFINWSFFSRGTYVDLYHDKFNIIEDKQWDLDIKHTEYDLMKSTNHWFDENHGEFNDDGHHFINFIQNHKFIMDYFLKYNFDFNLKLFNTISIYFKTLQDKGIKIFNLFIRDNEKLYYNKLELNINFNNTLGHILEFNPSYFDWLEQNEYKGEEEGHYTKGIQPILAAEILKRMETKMVEGLI